MVLINIFVKIFTSVSPRRIRYQYLPDNYSLIVLLPTPCSPIYSQRLKMNHIDYRYDFLRVVVCPIFRMYWCYCGPGSSVGIATDYGLDGQGSNPGGDEVFRPSTPALGPTQPPVKWVPGLSRGKVQPGRAADHSPPSSAAVMEE